jgi:hypothetical protein
VGKIERFPLPFRYFVCAAFVLFWMLVHFELKLSPLAGQYVGLPLILGFQLAIARRRFWNLWAFDALRFRLRKPYLILAVALLAFAVILVSFASTRVLAGTGQRFELCTLVAFGVWPASFALQEQDKANLRRALPWMVAAIGFGVIWRVAWTMASVMRPPHFSFWRTEDLLAMWLSEFIGLFLFDEVAFRGALDPYLRGSESGKVHPWFSAVFIGALWALWHLPVYNRAATTFPGLFTQVVRPFYLMVMINGFFFAFTARRSRTLVPSAALHALGNAYLMSTQF